MLLGPSIDFIEDQKKELIIYNRLLHRNYLNVIIGKHVLLIYSQLFLCKLMVDEVVFFVPLDIEYPFTIYFAV
jgi:chorismate-pyruvate lyase